MYIYNIDYIVHVYTYIYIYIFAVTYYFINIIYIYICNPILRPFHGFFASFRPSRRQHTHPVLFRGWNLMLLGFFLRKKKCLNKPAITGNGDHRTYKNADFCDSSWPWPYSIGHMQQASTSRASTKRMLRPKDDKDNKGNKGTMKLSPSRNQEVVRRDVTMKRLPRGCAITKYRSHQSKNWLVVEPYPSEKYESQLGWLFLIYGKIKNVPNHQPEELGVS